MKPETKIYIHIGVGVLLYLVNLYFMRDYVGLMGKDAMTRWWKYNIVISILTAVYGYFTFKFVSDLEEKC